MGGFCPLIRDKCVKEDCMMWSQDECVAVRFFRTAGAIVFEPLSQETVRTSKGEESKASTMGEEELAAELVSFTKRLCPGVSGRMSVDTHAYKFWSKEGVNPLAPTEELKTKIEKVETLAQKTLDEEFESRISDVRRKTAEELAEELLSFVSEEFGLEEWCVTRKSHLYWLQKGLERHRPPDNLILKIEKVEAIADKEYRSKQEALRRREIETEKELLNSVVPECLSWAKDNSIVKVTKADVNAFLADQGMRFSHETVDLLYWQVRSAMRSGKQV